MRPINSDTLYEKVKTAYENAPWQVRSIYGWFMNIITSEPMIDTIPMRHARWKIGIDHGTCTACGNDCWASSVFEYNYCPNCGAKIDLE